MPAAFIGLDRDMSPDELEEKARLITQVLELQNTLDGKHDLHIIFKYIAYKNWNKYMIKVY